MPDHAGPVWKLHLDNLTRSWSITTEQGAIPDLVASPVQLLAPFDTEWGYTNDQPPAQLDPSTATFVIGAPSVAALPEIEIDDKLDVALGRPDDRGAFMSDLFLVSDVVVDLDPHRSPFPAIARVTAVDEFGRLDSIKYTKERAQAWEYWPYGPADRLRDLAAHCRFNLAIPTEMDYSAYSGPPPPDNLPQMGDVDPQGRSALDLLRTIIALMPMGNQLWTLIKTPIEPNFSWYNLTRGDPSSTTWFTFAIVQPNTHDWTAGLTLSRVGNGPVNVATKPTASQDSDTLVIPARAIVSPAQLRKDRRNRSTTLVLSGAGLANGAQAIVRYQITNDPGRVERQLTGQSYLEPDALDQPAGAVAGTTARAVIRVWQPWLRDPGVYALPEIPILADELTDAELDNLARKFTFTQIYQNQNIIMVPQLTITDLDPQIRPYGYTAGGALGRVKFTISNGGRLVITVRPATAGMPPYDGPSPLVNAIKFRTIGAAGGPTFAQLGALTAADMRIAGV